MFKFVFTNLNFAAFGLSINVFLIIGVKLINFWDFIKFNNCEL